MNIDKVVKEIKTFENVGHLDYDIKQVNNQLEYGRFITCLLEKAENKEINTTSNEIIKYLNKINEEIGYYKIDRLILEINNNTAVGRMYISLLKQAEKGNFK